MSTIVFKLYEERFFISPRSYQIIFFQGKERQKMNRHNGQRQRRNNHDVTASHCENEKKSETRSILKRILSGSSFEDNEEMASFTDSKEKFIGL